MGLRDKLGLSSSIDPRDVVVGIDDSVERGYLAAGPTRTIATGTTYSSNGAVPVEPPELDELGSSGSPLFRETVPTLTSRAQAIRQWDIMANNDAAVDVSLRAAKTPILGANFYFESYSDDQVDVDIAHFVEDNLMWGMSAPFSNVLIDILRMYEYGFSVAEKVYEQREWAPHRAGANRKVYTCLRKLAPRPTPQVAKFNYDDNGGPVSIAYNAIRTDGSTDLVDIPIQKAVVFVNDRKGGNLTGKSILRTAYKHWTYKDGLYKIDAIQKERHSLGVPKAKLQPGFKPADVEAARTLVRNIRTNEEAGMVLPPSIDVEFAEVKGQLVDVMKSIEHHNGMIMLNIMVQFLLLGIESSGGGRATSGSQQDMFNKSLKYIGQSICDAINLYVVPQLVMFNFNTDSFPRMKVRNIGETKDLQQWASAIANLITQNAITVDYEFEQWIREVADAPKKMGGRQTPENQPSGWHANNKGGVQPQGKNNGQGNMPAPNDNAGT